MWLLSICFRSCLHNPVRWPVCALSDVAGSEGSSRGSWRCPCSDSSALWQKADSQHNRTSCSDEKVLQLFGPVLVATSYLWLLST